MKFKEEDGTKNDYNRGRGQFLNYIIDVTGLLPSRVFCVLSNSKRISSSSRSSISSGRKYEGNDKEEEKNKNDKNTKNENENGVLGGGGGEGQGEGQQQ